MNNLRNKLAATLLLSTLATASATVLAGAADLRSNDGSKMKFEYSGDDKLRITMEQPGSYMLMLGNDIYVVTDNDGQVMVMSLNQAMGMFAGMAAGATPNTVEGELLSLDASGREEVVAGIKGEVYAASYIDHEGNKQNTELVLAKHPKAVELQRAMFNMMRSMARAAGKEKETGGADELQGRLLDMDKGILRYGNEMWVTAISDRKIDPARFELPAEPTDLSALQGVFGAAGGSGGGGTEAESGGFMSGILDAIGGQSDRQQKRVEGKTEDEINEQADKATDSVIDKAFGKLFGK